MYNMYRTGIGGGADVTSSHLTSLGPIASYGHPLAAGLTARYGSTHGHLPGYNSPMTNVTANSRMPYENVHNINPGVSDGNKDVSGSVNREVSSVNTNRDVLRDENYGQTFPTSRSTMSADRSSPVEYLPSSSSPVYSSSGSPSQDINNVDTSSTLSFESDASHSDGGPQSKQRKTVAKGAPYIPSYMDLSNGPEPCVVCSDAATGYHYRCMTCEGCKGFFRRTIQKNLQYHCKWNKTCVIDKTTRNQCQECRFIKCIQVGMATDLVLNERQRTAKRKLIEDNRERRKEDTVKMKVREYTDSQEVLTDYDRGLICEVVTAYEFTAGKTKSKSNGEYDRLGAPGDGVQTADPESWQNLADAMTPSIVKVVEFAKGVPGFIQLNVDDQILLLKSCCMEIMCLRAACKFDPDTETLTLNNGTQIHKSQIHHGNLAVLIEPIFEFAIGLARLKLDKAEVALLAAVLLMQSDRSGLQEPEAVEKLQDSILGAFKRYIAENRPYQPVHWAKILMKVTDLRTISTRHAERVLCIRLDNSGEIPPLLLEVFNEGSAS